MTLSAAEESRQGELDKVLDSQQLDFATPGELFALVDAIDSQSALKRAFTDPAASWQAKQGLARRLFEGKVGGQALNLLMQAAGLRWRSGRSLVDAVERQAVRAELSSAQAHGQLDEVTDELFRFAQTVQGSPELRAALSDRSRPLSGRQELVRNLLAGKATGWTSSLASRAAAGRNRNFETTVDGYLALASQLRNRDVAKVTVAREMTDEQKARLQVALSSIAGRQVDLQFTIDPDVIGGVRVELGNEIIQGTIADRLEQAKRQLG